MPARHSYARIALASAVVAVASHHALAHPDDGRLTGGIQATWSGPATGTWETDNWTFTGPHTGNYPAAGTPKVDNAAVSITSYFALQNLVIGPSGAVDLRFVPNPNIPGQLATMLMVNSYWGGLTDLTGVIYGAGPVGNVHNDGVMTINPTSYLVVPVTYNPNTAVIPAGYTTPLSTGAIAFYGNGTLNLAPADDAVTPFLPHTDTVFTGVPNSTSSPTDIVDIHNEAGHTIQGYGTLAYQHASFQNQGTISANTPGHTLTLSIPVINAYNSGTLKATNGGTLAISSPFPATPYTLQMYDRPGNGTVLAEDNSTVTVKDLNIIAGHFVTAGTGRINMSGKVTLDSARFRWSTALEATSVTTLDGNINMSGGSLNFKGHVWVDGLSLGNNSAAGELLLTKTVLDAPYIVGDPNSLNIPINTVTLAGPGTIIPLSDPLGQNRTIYAPGSITLSDNPNNVIRPNPTNGADVYVAPNFTISGAGKLILPGHIAGNIIAHGTSPLILQASPSKPTTADYGSTFTADVNSELDIVNAPGTTNGFTNFYRDPGTGKSTLTTGTYVAKGYLAFPDALDTNNADLHLYPNGRFIKAGQYSYDALGELPENNGVITFHDGVSLTTTNTTNFTNNGFVKLAGDANHITYSSPVTGGGGGAFSIEGNDNVLTFTKAFTGNSLQITGNNNSVNFAVQPLSTVPITVQGPSTFAIPAPAGPGNALPVVNLTASQGATIILQGALPSTTIPAGASFTLDGPTSKFANEHGDNLLPSVTDVLGSLTVTSGATLPSTNLHNAGHLTIGAGSNQTLASIVQDAPGAQLTVDGSLTSPSVDIIKGSLNGYFNVTGNVHLHAGATLDPGHSPAPNAAVNGNLVLDPGSVASMDAVSIIYNYGDGYLGWALDPDNSDHVQVDGDLTVAGALVRINQLLGYDPYSGAPVDPYPYLGESFTLFTYTGTLTGQFAGVIQPSSMPAGLGYVLHYSDHTITATVETLVPEPTCLTLLALPAALSVTRRRRTPNR